MRRFDDRVDRSGGPDACWPWTGARDDAGYGIFWFKGKNVKAHRFAWRQENGEIPEGMNVCHRCDNPPCCNPRHLFPGTGADNTADKVAKGRQARGAATKPELRAKGERQHLARLTSDGVALIRASSETGAELARRLGVDQATVTRVRRRETWKHLA